MYLMFEDTKLLTFTFFLESEPCSSTFNSCYWFFFLSFICLLVLQDRIFKKNMILIKKLKLPNNKSNIENIWVLQERPYIYLNPEHLRHEQKSSSFWNSSLLQSFNYFSTVNYFLAYYYY